ncbi:Ig-like domain-containing protein [Clostridium coskatii]|uniref:SbsA Ig-like domain-containing protein n=1 Tax=Clostridium coskatii TaxID=1705578 RepID=A0A162L9T1_9CLOT|nr:Ig-like domain-containing protein [Clostridium coskatii]OAA90696.1 hypothetical protein WX73_02061 [Clostridium coskatii]OBR97468.1 hypothetical protein CLCOS_03240 [Clostridium coskatii]
MKKKIAILAMFFTLVFTSSVSAKTLEPRYNVAWNKIWTITFSQPIQEVEATVTNINGKTGEDGGIMGGILVDKNNNKVTVTPVLSYQPGTYILKITNATAINGQKLKEPVTMQFVVNQRTH